MDALTQSGCKGNVLVSARHQGKPFRNNMTRYGATAHSEATAVSGASGEHKYCVRNRCAGHAFTLGAQRKQQRWITSFQKREAAQTSGTTFRGFANPVTAARQ